MKINRSTIVQAAIVVAIVLGVVGYELWQNYSKVKEAEKAVNSLFENDVPKRGISWNEISDTDGKISDIKGNQETFNEKMEMVETFYNIEELADGLFDDNKLSESSDSSDVEEFIEELSYLPQSHQDSFAEEMKIIEETSLANKEKFETKKKEYGEMFDIVENNYIDQVEEKGIEAFEEMIDDLQEENNPEYFDEIIENTKSLLSQYRMRVQEAEEEAFERRLSEAKSIFNKGDDSIIVLNYYFKKRDGRYKLFAEYEPPRRGKDMDIKVPIESLYLEDEINGVIYTIDSTDIEKAKRLRGLPSYDSQTNNGEEYTFRLIKAGEINYLGDFGSEAYSNATRLAFVSSFGRFGTYDLKMPPLLD